MRTSLIIVLLTLVLVTSTASPITSKASFSVDAGDISIKEVSVLVDSVEDTLSIDLVADAEVGGQVAEELVFDKGNATTFEQYVHLPPEWADLLNSFIERVDDSILRVLINGSNSSITFSITVKSLLRYILSDEELYTKYMNIYLNGTRPNPCMSLLGRTGFNLYLFIPKELRQLLFSEEAVVRFELRSGLIDEDSLDQIASSIASLPRSNVSVSGTSIAVEQRIEDGASPRVCAPYSKDFWALIGVPRVVFVMPNMPIERGYPVFIQFEVSRAPIEYAEIRYSIPKDVFDAVFPRGSTIDRVSGGYRVVPPESVAEYFYYDNGTVVIRKMDRSISRLFVPQLLLNVTGFGRVDLGNATIHYCLAFTGTCSSATVPVYSLTTGSSSLVIPPPNLSEPGTSIDIKTWALLGLVAIAVMVYTLKKGGRL